jgi:acyl carrier protein
METMKTLLDIINTIRVNADKAPFETLTDDMDLRKDLGFNSLYLAELTVRIESEFGIDIFEDGLVFSIGEIKEKLNAGNG